MTFFRSSSLITRETPLAHVMLDRYEAVQFFKAQCGDTFSMNKALKEFIAGRYGLTCGDLADEWLRWRAAQPPKARKQFKLKSRFGARL